MTTMAVMAFMVTMMTMVMATVMTFPMTTMPTRSAAFVVTMMATGYTSKGLSIKFYTVLQIGDRNISHVGLQIDS